MNKINIAKFLKCSEIEGPGKRFVLWFQGCRIGCKNCSNTDMLSLEEKLYVSVDVIIDLIKSSIEDFSISGVTLIGGEPFLQPDGLEELINKIYSLNLNIICFTGYKYENLKNEYSNFINKIDILIDGPFIFSKLDYKRRLIGSTNQRVLKLGEKLKECDYFEKPHSQIEIQLYKDRLELNGDGVLFNGENGFDLSFNKPKK